MSEPLKKAINNFVKSKTREELESHVAEERLDWFKFYEDEELREDFIKKWEKANALQR